MGAEQNTGQSGHSEASVHLSVVGGTEQVRGKVAVPNSKYHAHRALILASLAPGLSRIRGLSDAGHVQSTVALLRGLGTRIDIEGDRFLVHGGPYRRGKNPVSVGSSGTTLYFMLGLACLAGADVTVAGQRYFRRRPVGPLLRSLGDLGVQSSHGQSECGGADVWWQGEVAGLRSLIRLDVEP